MSVRDTGLVLINKPSGITSFKALSGIKKAIGHGKVGHAGTLDKFAEGLLLVAAGKCTRLISILEGLPKRYEGTIRFGRTTTTLDPEGECIGETTVPTLETIENTIPHFIGDIMQVPPAFSAVHVNGRRAYQRTLAGEAVELPPRPVHISAITITGWEEPFLSVEVECSKGTYIRSLARDVGEQAGSSAYLSSLRRTAIGDFSVDDAVDPEDFDPDRHMLTIKEFIGFLPAVGICRVGEEPAKKILHGVPFRSEWLGEAPEKELLAVFDPCDIFLSLIEKNGADWKYRMVADGGIR